MTCKECSWDKVYCRGLCHTCYNRFKRRGTLEEHGTPSRKDPLNRPGGWLVVGDWVQEIEPDATGKRLFGQVMKTKGGTYYTADGEVWASVKLAYTRATIPIRVKNLMGYDGPIPDPIPPHLLPKFDMREVLGCR